MTDKLIALALLGISAAACAPSLSESVGRGDLRAAAAAVDRGEDLNKGDSDGPPLLSAARRGHREIVEMLLSKSPPQGRRAAHRPWRQGH
jgi:hypothetical protein